MAALVSLVAREYGDFAIIMAVVVIDVVLGFAQEYQAQKTYTALKGLLKPTTTVLRDGERREVEAWELVPGDLALLSMGEKVPADGRVRESVKLGLDEAILTGEAEPDTKDVGQNAFMGTAVVAGRGLIQIEKTGPALSKVGDDVAYHFKITNTRLVGQPGAGARLDHRRRPRQPRRCNMDLILGDNKSWEWYWLGGTRPRPDTISLWIRLLMLQGQSS